MDVAQLIAWNKKYDEIFAKKHPDFVAWWHKHPHCDPDSKWAVKPRVAWLCQCYQDEFLEAKQFGLNEV